MKVFQVISETRLNNAADLAKAFSRNQWINIIVHFNKGQMGNDAKQVRRYIDEIQRTIGHSLKTAYMSPEMWNATAVRYNMDISAPVVTWQAIYNHLAPHKDKTAEVPAAAVEPTFAPSQDTDYTDETKQQVSKWVAYSGNDPMSSEDIDKYFRDWLTALAKFRDREWVQKLNGTVNGRRTPAYISMRTNHKSFMDRANGTPIPKLEIDDWLYSWLNTADYAFKSLPSE